MAEDIVKKIMTEATRSAYLTLYSASLLKGKSDAEIARDVEAGIRDLAGGGSPPTQHRIRMGPSKVKRARPLLGRFLLHSLMIRLDLALHASLNALAGRPPGKDVAIEKQLKDSPFETLDVWAVRDGVQLSVLRNLVVHAEATFHDDNKRANGKLKKMCKILEDRGMSEHSWHGKRLRSQSDVVEWCRSDARRILSSPAFEDYTRLKKAVRKITRVAVESSQGASE